MMGARVTGGSLAFELDTYSQDTESYVQEEVEVALAKATAARETLQGARSTAANRLVPAINEGIPCKLESIAPAMRHSSLQTEEAGLAHCHGQSNKESYVACRQTSNLN